MNTVTVAKTATNSASTARSNTPATRPGSTATKSTTSSARTPERIAKDEQKKLQDDGWKQIAAQAKQQRELQSMSFLSNSLKAFHDTMMNIINNMK